MEILMEFLLNMEELILEMVQFVPMEEMEKQMENNFVKIQLLHLYIYINKKINKKNIYISYTLYKCNIYIYIYSHFY